jgi:hypothetical protein
MSGKQAKKLRKFLKQRATELLLPYTQRPLLERIKIAFCIIIG